MHDLLIALAFISVVVAPAVFAAMSGTKAAKASAPSARPSDVAQPVTPWIAPSQARSAIHPVTAPAHNGHVNP